MKYNLNLLLLCIMVSALLYACGGGDSGSSPDTTADAPSVSAITAGTVMYKKVSLFTVTGQHLDKGITATAIGCSNLLEQQGGTDTSRSYSCVPFFVNPIVTISATTGATSLKQFSMSVPNPQVTIETSMGTIVVELRPDKAKLTVDNFLQYVNDGFYSSTLFHRVVTGFVVQGGGYSVNDQSTLKPARNPIILESPAATGLKNTLGTIAMARTSTLNSATSEFYFNTVDNTSLDTASGGYAVFGSVIRGMDVVKAIEAVAVDSNSWPTSTVTIISATQTGSL